MRSNAIGGFSSYKKVDYFKAIRESRSAYRDNSQHSFT